MSGDLFTGGFDEVFRSEGRVIGKAPIVSMPHWGGILSQRDLRALVAYIKSLKGT